MSGTRSEDAWKKKGRPVDLRQLPEADKLFDPNKFSVEVKACFSRFPQLCHKVGGEGCRLCEWRRKRLAFVHELHHADMCDVGGSERELHDFHSGDIDGLEVVQDAPAVYDMLKVRGLFDLLAGPPRRERVTNDMSLKNLAGVAAPLDRRRFVTENCSVVNDLQFRRLGELLFEIVTAKAETIEEMTRACCTYAMFESAIARSGLQHRLTKRRILRAFDRLLELERLSIECHRKAERTLTRTLGRESSGQESARSRPLSEGMKTSRRNVMRGDLSHNELRRGTSGRSAYSLSGAFSEADSDGEQIDDAQFKEPGFLLHTWARATQHATCVIDHPIAQGEDMEWTLVIYDLLDMEWPWKPLEGTPPEEQINDEKGQHFSGLFVGVTHKPIAMPPKITDSSLSGIRARDGQVLHRGRKVEKEPEELMPIEKSESQPTVLHFRLDRRPLVGQDIVKRSYACRLWMLRAGVDTEAKVVMDNFGFQHGREVYPVLYANYPVHDIVHAVKFRGGGKVVEDGQPRSPRTPRFLPEESIWKRADSTVGKRFSFRQCQSELHGLSPRGSMPPSRRSTSPTKRLGLTPDGRVTSPLKRLSHITSVSQEMEIALPEMKIALPQ